MTSFDPVKSPPPYDNQPQVGVPINQTILVPSAPILSNTLVAPQAYNLDTALQKFSQDNEINPKYISALRSLIGYDVCIICDDSGSMKMPASGDNALVSRWNELYTSMQIMMAAIQA